MGQNGCGVVVKQVERTESVHETVLRAVSAATERSLIDLPPLQTTIDVNALNELFSSSETISSLQFQYGSFEITVEPDRVYLEEAR